MSRITDYILEPKVVYTEGGFLVRVKVIDDYKYKKYIVSENLHYKTVQGTSFTLTNADTTKQASIIEIKGKGKGNLIAKDNWELGSISGSGSTMGENTSATNRIRNIEHIAVEPNTTYTLTLLGDTSTVAFVFEYNSEKVGTKRIPSTWTTTPFAFTTQDTTYFVRVIFSTTDVTLGQNVELRKEGDSVVTGDNNIVVSNKNLFNGNNVEITNTTNWTINFENNVLTVTHNNSYSTGYPILEVGILKAGTYVISGIFETKIGLYRNGTYSTLLESGSTFSVNGTESIRLVFSSGISSGENKTFTNVQLEKGSQATTYEPYVGNSYRVDLRW